MFAFLSLAPKRDFPESNVASQIEMKMAIYAANYPSIRITLELQDLIMDYVGNGLKARVKNEPKIEFSENELNGGKLIITCVNKQSAVWLNLMIKGANKKRLFKLSYELLCKPVSDSQKVPVFTLFHPGSSVDFETFKAELVSYSSPAAKWCLQEGSRLTFAGTRDISDAANADSKGILLNKPIYIEWQPIEENSDFGKF